MSTIRRGRHATGLQSRPISARRRATSGSAIRIAWRHARRTPRTGRAPGSVLIAVAAWLLALTGGGALFVSFSAQYAYIFTVRRQDAASVIEALLLDLLMIVFTLLALGLSRAGKSARAERILILACAAASSYMNVSAADVASPRSVAAYAIAPGRAGRGGGPGRGGDPPPRPSRPGTLGLEHRWPRRGGRGQDRRAGAAVLSAVRPGRAGDGPGATPDGAGRRPAASRFPRRPRLRRSSRPAPRRPSCSPCTAPTPTTATAAEPAGSPLSWPRRRGCRQEPPAAICTPNWTAGHHDRGPARGTLAPRSGREPGRPGCAARGPARGDPRHQRTARPGRASRRPEPGRPVRGPGPDGRRRARRRRPARARRPVLDRPGPRHLPRAAGRPAAVGRHRAPPALRRLRAAGTAGPATSTPSGNCPPWPPSGTTPTAAHAPTWPGPWSSTTAGCPAPCAASPASPASACRTA